MVASTVLCGIARVGLYYIVNFPKLTVYNVHRLQSSCYSACIADNAATGVSMSQRIHIFIDGMSFALS